MRPVDKAPWPQVNGVNKIYATHGLATGELHDNLGSYCSYCEVFSSDLEVEHMISQDQDISLATNWDNFLLGCGRCNGRSNKSNKPVDFSIMHFPHLNNTMKSFSYKEGGYVEVNPAINDRAKIHAENMMKLVGLDKYPGNPSYQQENLNDSRWMHRRVSWELAVKYLPTYIAGGISDEFITDLAIQKGFFSVWYTVYKDHSGFKKMLIEKYKGTSLGCFNALDNYNLLDRNLVHPNDTT